MTRGFSLVEVLVAMTLGSLLLAGVVSLAVGTMRSHAVQAQLAGQQAEARMALLRIGQDVRAARRVVMGHDCTLAGCVAPVAAVLGSRDATRARGTDVLTLERFDPATTEPIAITYYVKRTTMPGAMALATLMRCERQRCDEVARGIERLDFVYAMRDVDGDVRYLDARGIAGHGGRWDDVVAVDVHLLVNGQASLHGHGEAMLAYAYPGEGAMRPLPPDARGPGGLSPGRQGFERATLRRPFSALFSLRHAVRP